MRDLGFRHAQFIDRIGDSYRWHGENVSAQEVESVVLKHPFVEQAIVYGVKVAASSGKAGMLTMKLTAKVNFNTRARRQFLTYLRTHLPSYAIPRFVRITQSLSTTSTFKFTKNIYQNEGYDPAIVKDALYLYHVKSNNYEKLTTEVHKQILSGSLKL